MKRLVPKNDSAANAATITMTTNNSTKVNAGNDFREDFLSFMGFIIEGKCQDLNLGLGNISRESPLSANAFKPLAAMTTFSDAV
jgi:hypothetical protein